MLLSSVELDKLSTFLNKAIKIPANESSVESYVFGPGKDFYDLYSILNQLGIGHFATFCSEPKLIGQAYVYILNRQAEKFSQALASLNIDKFKS